MARRLYLYIHDRGGVNSAFPSDIRTDLSMWTGKVFCRSTISGCAEHKHDDWAWKFHSFYISTVFPFFAILASVL